MSTEAEVRREWHKQAAWTAAFVVLLIVHLLVGSMLWSTLAFAGAIICAGPLARYTLTALRAAVQLEGEKEHGGR